MPVPGPERRLSLESFFFPLFLLAANFAASTLQHICCAPQVQVEFTSTRRWALALRPEHHP